MRKYSGITLNHRVLHFVLIFKSVQAISYWGTRWVLSVLVSYFFILPECFMCCLYYILLVILQIGYFIDVLLLLWLSCHQRISKCLIFTRK